MEEWFGPIFAAAFGVGLFGVLFIAPIYFAMNWGAGAAKVLAVLGIVCVIALSIVIHNTTVGNNSSKSSSGSSESHSCCICGASASNRYGGDWWCTKHYYMAKASEDDLSP